MADALFFALGDDLTRSPPPHAPEVRVARSSMPEAQQEECAVARRRHVTIHAGRGARNADEKTGRERCDEKEDATARRRREHAHQVADVAASARSRTALVTAALTSCHTRRSDSTDACAPG